MFTLSWDSVKRNMKSWIFFLFKSVHSSFILDIPAGALSFCGHFRGGIYLFVFHSQHPRGNVRFEISRHGVLITIALIFTFTITIAISKKVDSRQPCTQPSLFWFLLITGVITTNICHTHNLVTTILFSYKKGELYPPQLICDINKGIYYTHFRLSDKVARNRSSFSLKRPWRNLWCWWAGSWTTWDLPFGSFVLSVSLWLWFPWLQV